MKKNLITKRIDYLFLYTILFLISFIVFNYFVTSRMVCFLLSFLTAYTIYLAITRIANKRKNHALIIRQDTKNIDALRKVLISNGTEFTFNYLKSVFNGKIVDNTIETTTQIFYVNLSKPILNIYDFNNICSTLTTCPKQKFVIAESIDNELSTALSNLKEKITIITYKELYFEYIKDKFALPNPIYEEKAPTKNTLGRIAKIAFARNKAKGYFVNGILIFAFSFIYPFKNYYLIFSLGLFILALTCLFEPFKNY